jgi:hypothetical protein
MAASAAAASFSYDNAVGPWNSLNKWLWQNGCFLKKGDKKGAKETHLLLNGGCLLVPDKLNEEFLRQYLKAYESPLHRLYVVEKKTEPTFKMLAELDIVLRGDLDISLQWFIDTLIRPCFLACTDELYPGRRHRICVCGVIPGDPPKADNPEKTKYGIHLIWPDLVVDLQTARKIRALILLRIFDAIQRDPEGPIATMPIVEGWETIFDPMIFDKNGLRMIWSRKAPPCPACKGVSRQILIDEKLRKKQKLDSSTGLALPVDEVFKRPVIQPCRLCRNTGKVDEGRKYELSAIVSSRGEEADREDLRAAVRDPLLQLRMCSIRAVPAPPISQVVVPEVNPEDAKRMVKYESVRVRGGKKNADDGEGKPIHVKRQHDESVSEFDTVLETLDYDTKAYAVFSELCAQVYHGAVTSLRRSSDKRIYIMNTTSHECRNKLEPHTNATVYYYLYPDHAVQYCWSSKTTPGKFGQQCSDYKSPPIPYPPEFAARVCDPEIFSKRYMAKLPSTQSILAVINFGISARAGGSQSSLSGEEDSSASHCHIPPWSMLQTDPELKGKSFAEIEDVIAKRAAQRMSKTASSSSSSS